VQITSNRLRIDRGHPKGDDQHDTSRGLDERERREAVKRSAVNAATVHEAIRLEGEDELSRPSSALAWSGLAAGLSMGFSLVAQGAILPYLPAANWSVLVAKLGYTVGFLIVVLGRQQLFTENTLTPILPLLSQGGRSRLWNVLRLWSIVLAANLLGGLIFAWIIGQTQAFPADVRQAFSAVSGRDIRGDFWTVAVRGVFAGWLIALMVWVLPFAESARVTVIMIITYIVSIGGFNHIVAGSIEAFYLVFARSLGLGSAVLGYLVPTLLGNVVGGVSFVAALNHAQVKAGAPEG
jgi:formate-nitrite transporter family protein